MKAISLWQPWASALFGPKRFETRSWQTSHRGRLLIHAAKTWNYICVSSLHDFWDRGILMRGDLDQLYPRGVLLGTVELIDVLTTETIRTAPWLESRETELKLGDFSDGRFGWQLENARRFKTPIPYRGAQGLFQVPDHVVAEAMRACQ